MFYTLNSTLKNTSHLTRADILTKIFDPRRPEPTFTVSVTGGPEVLSGRVRVAMKYTSTALTDIYTGVNVQSTCNRHL